MKDMFFTIKHNLEKHGRRPHWKGQWSSVLPSVHCYFLTSYFSVPSLRGKLAGIVQDTCIARIRWCLCYSSVATAL